MNRARKPLAVSILSALCVTSVASFARPARAAEPLATVVVDAGEHDRTDTPVSFPAPAGMKADATHRLVAGDLTLPCQIEPSDPPRAWFLLPGKTPAGTKRTFRLLPGAAADGPVVAARKGDKALELTVERPGEGPAGRILRYHHQAGELPEKVPAVFARSAYIHPVWSPDGAVLTDDFPRDHYHHKGVWMPWTNAKWRGRKVDFWNLAGRTGTVRFKAYRWTASGPVFGGFAADHEFVVYPGSDKEEVALHETWTVRAYAPPAGPAKLYVWDAASRQTCATDQPLVLPRYRYGGMAFRGARAWRGEDAYTTTDDGTQRNKAHGKRVRWAALGGTADGQWAGGAYLSHPDNFGHPEPIRAWSGKKNVFVSFTAQQLGEFRIVPGEPRTWRYRFVAYDGKLDAGLIDRLWTDFAHPPKVTVND